MSKPTSARQHSPSRIPIRIRSKSLLGFSASAPTPSSFLSKPRTNDLPPAIPSLRMGPPFQVQRSAVHSRIPISKRHTIKQEDSNINTTQRDKTFESPMGPTPFYMLTSKDIDSGNFLDLYTIMSEIDFEDDCLPLSSALHTQKTL